MRRSLLTLLAPFLLAGCGDGADGYTFEQKEFVRSAPAIVVVTHPSLADLREKAPGSAKDNPNRDLMAWSILRPNGCELHVVDPAVSYKPEWIGHEAAHCIWGRWHP